MKFVTRWSLLPLVLFALIAGSARAQAPADPLPSWNEGPRKKAILDFVARVTKEGGADFVPVAERIATFDNDGTLWSEKPIYFQFDFAIARVKALVEKHPEYREKQPFKAALADDIKTLLADGHRNLVEMVMATHTGMTTDEFDDYVEAWVKSARHPRFKRPYTDLVYQPMLEVLAYLRANGFNTFVVSGGGIEFMRVWTDRVYGIPPQQIVGSSGKLKYDLRDGKPVLVRLPQINFIDDGPGKPVGIHQHIGRRPVMAFGNSDGDFEMLQYTTAGKGPRFALIVHHTDAEREWAYDRNSDVGRLDKALDAAPKEGWLLMDMKRDWKVIYPFEKK
jgi:hypothetical protein